VSGAAPWAGRALHFVGIGGAGMSGLALIARQLGATVTGSDRAESSYTARLRAAGIEPALGHDAANLPAGAEVVVSTAIPAENPELAAARAAGAAVIHRGALLGELTALKRAIAIAGTHGKTTTCGMVAHVLRATGRDPAFAIGGELRSAGSNAGWGEGEWIVAEADESDASFLNLSPMIAVITNIDVDHMETYGHDFARLEQAFVEFTQRLPFYGAAVLCIDDPNVRRILPQVSKPVIGYGLSEGARFRAVNLVADAGRMHFDVLRADAGPLAVTLNLPGEHNVRNALAAIAVADELGVDDDAIVKALSEFHGVGRRFQRWGELPARGGGRFALVDDYGHHPVEMAATLAAARGAFPGRRIVLAFQPHRFTRTRDLFEDFVRVLSGADQLLLAEVYPAGEQPIVAADSRSLARAVRVGGRVEPVFVEDIAEMPETILELARAGDVVLTMGAGSIGSVPALLEEAAGGR